MVLRRVSTSTIRFIFCVFYKKSRMQCSPERENVYHDGSCLNLKEVKEVVKEYNKTVPLANKVSGSKKVDLIGELGKRFGDCSDQCWIEQPFIKANAELYNKLKDKYRPTKPSSWTQGKRVWLTDVDINRVMTQYMKKYRDFAFLGVVPIDFRACHVSSLCNFSVDQPAYTGKRQFGLILNLDKSTGKGTHWVALYFTLNKASKHYGLCYYDSYGQHMPKEVHELAKDVAKSVDDVNFKRMHNPYVHQKKNSECGVFSMNFIKECLENNNMTYDDILSKNIGSDDQMFQMRNYFYSKHF